MRRGRTVLKTTVAGAAAGVLVLLSGCSGDDPSGLSKEPVDKIILQSQDAVRTTAAVHITGEWPVQDRDYRLDLQVKKDGAIGTVVTAGSTIGLLRVGEDLYVRGDEALYLPRDGRADPETETTVAKLRDRYVRVRQEDPAYARLIGFTRMDTMTEPLFKITGKVKKNGREKIHKVETVQLAGDSGRGGRLFVALEGKPFPLRYTAGKRKLELTDFDKDFPVAAPPADQVLDYGTLTGGQQPGEAAPGGDQH